MTTKIINFLSLVFLLTSTLFLTESCDKSPEVLDNCIAVICNNGGTCVDGACDCPDGFSGVNCEIQDLCFGIICENDGTCVEGICECPEGFTGTNCESFDPTQTQFLLDNGRTPKELYDGAVPVDSLYGRAYAGGLIFYLNEEDGTGLIAAFSDQGTGVEWGCHGDDIIGLNNVTTLPVNPETEEGARIGDGPANTDAILDITNGCNDNNTPAERCRNLGENWFLPSREELNLMRINLHARGHGGFDGFFYWCSTEKDMTNAWRQTFGTGTAEGSQGNTLKLNGMSVRAARAF